MLCSHAALRQCVRLASNPTSLIPPTRPIFSLLSPWPTQQRPQSHFRRLLGTGYNSLRGRKRVTSKRKTTKPTAITSKPSRQSRAHSSPALLESTAEQRNTVNLLDFKSSVTPTSLPYHDRRSFLSWSTRNKINRNSTWFIGTQYEYTVIKALQAKNFTLKRCGGANDQGIDLIGHWTLPSPRTGLKILVQCKVGSPTPAFARELEGACSGGREEWRKEDVMAWLASPKPASSETWKTMERSTRPMGFAQISEGGLVQDLRWNAPAQEAGLDGLSKVDFHVSTKDADGKSRRIRRAVRLTANGEPWPNSVFSW